MRAYRHSSHGSSGGSSGGSYGGSSGGSSGGGSSGGSYSGGSSGGSYGSYGGYSAPAAYTSGYSAISGMSSSMPVESYRVIDQAPAGGEIISTPQPAGAPTTDSTMIPADAGLLVVELPADAKVFVNGDKTAATGGVRRFLSRGLAKGQEYEYSIRMVVDRDGVAHEETKVVALAAGSRATVSFMAKEASTASRQVAKKTSLTLHVPADAKVWLAGNETSSRGQTRLFETATLRDGQTWRNYEIRVVTTVEGKEQVVVKTIDLAAGSQIELALDPAAKTEAVARTAPADDTASIR